MLETGTFPCGVLGHTEIRNGSQISSRCGVGWRCPILCCGVDWRIIDLWCSRRPSSSITKREISHGRRLFLITVAEVGHHTLINIHDSAMCDPFESFRTMFIFFKLIKCMTVIHIIRREIYSKVSKKLSFSCNSPRLSGHRFQWRFWIVDPVWVQLSRPLENYFSNLVFFGRTRCLKAFKTQNLAHLT